MAHFFRAPDRRQRFLLPVDMMDWLPEDDIVHLVVVAVGLMDLSGFAATLIPDPSRLIDTFLPKGLRMKRLRARIVRDMQELVMRNGENLRWAILRGMDETFRRAGARFDEQLDDAIRATRSVIGDALARRRDTSFAVEPEVIRLDRAIEALSVVRKELAK